jgi:PAS domain S-box-containing protein
MLPDVLNSQLLPFKSGVARQWIRHKLIWFAVGFVLASGLVVGAALAYLHSQATQQGQRLAESFARVIEEQTTLSIQTVNLRLEMAADELFHLSESGRLSEDLAREMLLEQIKDLPTVRAMWVLNAQGDLVFSSDTGSIGVNMAERDYFQVYRSDPRTGFFIGNPVRSRTTGAWIVSAARPLTKHGGPFSGVIVAAIDPTYFDKLWRTVDIGDDSSISLFRRDGVLMMRTPFDEAYLGKNLADSTLFSKLLPITPNGAFQSASVLDGKLRTYAYRTLSAQPQLVVLVGQSYDANLAAWRKLAFLAVLIWFVASLVLATMCLFLDRMWQQRAVAEENLEESEQRLQLALHGADLGLWDWTTRTGQIVVNHRWRRMLGVDAYSPMPTVQMWQALVHPDDLPRLDQLISDVMRNPMGTDFETEVRVRHRDGHYIWIMDKGAVVERSANGRALRLVGTHMDITERKLASESLREINAQNRALLNAIPDLILTNRRDGVYLACHSPDPSLFLMSQERFLKKNVKDVLPPAIADQFLTVFGIALETNAVQELNYALTMDGHEMAYEARVVPSDQDTLITIVRDVTQRKRGQVKTRLSDHALKAISQGVVITKSDMCIVSTNEAFETITGYSEADILGRNCSFLQGPLTDPQAVKAIHDALVQEAAFAGEILNYRKDGVTFWNELTISPMRDEHGTLTHYIGVTRDVTARKLAEDQQRDSARHLQVLSKRVLEAQETERRRVAIELHDELGQSLTAIKINLQSNERFKGQSVQELNTENVRIVEDAIQQVRRLALALRPSMLDDLGLVPALHWIADQTSARSGFAIHFHPAISVARLAPEIETACFRIVQEALTNIARHAGARTVDVDLYDEGGELVMSVKDDGCGFNVDTMRDRASEGGSMGLPGMQERATLIGGRLTIDSSPGAGTTLRFCCPVLLREVQI